MLCTSCNSLEYSRSTSKTQPLKLSSSYLSKLNFAEPNHLNPLAGRDFELT